MLGTELPNVLRIQALTLSHVRAMLEREQRLRLRQLTEIFPLRINAVRSGGGPIQITICNLRLPESASTPPGGWPQPEVSRRCWRGAVSVCVCVGWGVQGVCCCTAQSQFGGSSNRVVLRFVEHCLVLVCVWYGVAACWRSRPICSCAVCCPVAQTTSAALGYLLLFIDQVGLIMGGPMLHESCYQGSTSSMWQPPGFWTRQPRSPSAVLPLNVLSTGQGAGAAAGQAAYASSTSRWGPSGLAGWQLEWLAGGPVWLQLCKQCVPRADASHRRST